MNKFPVIAYPDSGSLRAQLIGFAATESGAKRVITRAIKRFARSKTPINFKSPLEIELVGSPDTIGISSQFFYGDMGSRALCRMQRSLSAPQVWAPR